MRFVILSDTHFFVNGHGKSNIFWNMPLASDMELLTKQLAADLRAARPDFILHCGDVIDRCHPDNEEFAQRFFDLLPCPVYSVAGNHDSMDPSGKESFSRRYGLADGQCCYAKHFGDYTFLFLDTSYWLQDDGTVLPYRDPALYAAGKLRGMVVPQEEIAWLTRELEANRARKVILVTHAPLYSKGLYPAATLPSGKPGDPAGTDLDALMGSLGVGLCNRESILALIRSFSCVKAVFSGHWHIQDVCQSGGIVFCQTGSMREYPLEYRIAQEKNGVLTVRAEKLSDPSYAARSYCAERGNLWPRGPEEENIFTIDCNL